MKSFFAKLRYPQLIALFFALVILAGALLLSLPVATKGAAGTPFIDALLTAASSICVTGLAVYDTYAHWSVFGQVTILVLVQIGGIGFMSLATFFSLLLKRKIGLNERLWLQEASGSARLGGVVKMTRRILLGTLLFEVTGTVLLALRFCPEMGLGEGLYYAVFHAISAFCNAGVDLMGKYAPFSSLSAFAGDPLVCLTIAALIVVGGIGFLVWDDLLKHKWRWSRYMLHTKMVLVATAVLVLLGGVVVFAAESGGAMKHMGLGDKLVNALLFSVSTRTAGFSTFDMNSLSSATLMMATVLMIIGGSPGSTAGGIKTTSVFLLGAAVLATLKNREDITAFRRKLDPAIFRKACAVVTVFLAVAFGGVVLICLFQDLPMLDVIFEVVGAIATTGFTVGITAQLTVLSKIVLMLLMFFGRVGVLSLIYAFVKDYTPAALHYPEEKIMIG